MEIKKENVLAAFNTASESVKEVLIALFPELKEETAQKAANRPVTERVKTFEDACRELDLDSESLEQKWSDDNLMPDEIAYQKLRIICAALNEGWEPQFTEDEVRWYPWHWLYSQDEIDEMDDTEKTERHLMTTGDYQTEYAGFAFAYSNYAPSNTSSDFGSRLCLKSDTLAIYCGKQFIELWADFKLIRKNNL